MAAFHRSVLAQVNIEIARVLLPRRSGRQSVSYGATEVVRLGRCVAACRRRCGPPGAGRVSTSARRPIV